MAGMSLLLVALAGAKSTLDVSVLDSRGRQVFEQVAAEEFCSCNSALTLAGCLAQRPDCRVAQHLGRFVIRSIDDGAGADEILAALSADVLGPFCAPPLKLEVTGAPQSGPAGAPVVLVEFADFRCAHCKEAAPLVHATLARYRDRVRFAFLPFPLNNHPLGVRAAEASLAADAQGKFWPMYEQLFAHQDDDFEPQVLARAAKAAGVDVTRMTKELEAERFRRLVVTFKQQGLAAGVDSTPSFFVNGRLFKPTLLMTLSDRIELELDRNQGVCQ
ncbi:MAG: thioredoxin domain-containing protein [Deltaproteobacteria bacterium]|nr:thioredoxin domain-containing protein [Deltaproteobacteria bacterium]